MRFFLALTRYGTVRGASAALGVNHATVSRRLARLEDRLSARLFQRTPDGYRLTADGDAILDSARAIEAEVTRAEAMVEGSKKSVSGVVRITMTDLVFDLIRPVFAKLAEDHPALKIELMLGARLDRIELGRVDVALRFSDQPPPDLTGRLLGRLPATLYAATDTPWAAKGADLSVAPWVRWQAPWQTQRLETWPEAKFPGAPVVARVDSYHALHGMVRAGAGLGLLCPYVAGVDPGLTRLSDDIDEAGLDLWLLIHPDMRNLGRIRVVVDMMAPAVKRVLDTGKVFGGF